MASPKTLFLLAFDFDHTILDANSDLSIQEVYHKEPIPEYFKVAAKEKGWVTYMHEMFRFHYPKELNRSHFHKVLDRLPLVPKISECIHELHRLGGEIIVISDANTYFIKHVLTHAHLLPIVSAIFSNPAEFDGKGQLVIRPYMDNLECTLSSRNMCKGKVLMDYVKSRNKQGQNFEFIGFAGDGFNDFCPMLRLRQGDLACGRAGYSIVPFIKQKKRDRILIKAKILYWKSGDDIVDAAIKKLKQLGHGKLVDAVQNSA